VVLGAFTVARFQLFARIDERAHYAFVQEVAEEGRLPVLGRDLISAEAQAINDGTWPQPSPSDPRTLGFAGQSYEAFQPPLYYVLAAPVFAVAGDHRHKVFALRAFDLILLGVAVGLWAFWPDGCSRTAGSCPSRSRSRCFSGLASWRGP